MKTQMNSTTEQKYKKAAKGRSSIENRFSKTLFHKEEKQMTKTFFSSRSMFQTFVPSLER